MKDRKFALLNKSGKITDNGTFKEVVDAFNELKHNEDISLIEVNDNNELIRYIITDNDYCYEGCSHCGKDAIIKCEFRVQYCNECGKKIMPCNMCFSDKVNCNECPLNGRYEMYLGGIKLKDTLG